MKTKSIITEISHEDLVNLLSTASYGSDYIGLDYNTDDLIKLPDYQQYECTEDRMAALLLAGYSVTIYDMYTEDEEDFYGSLPHSWDSDNETMDYTVTLKDIKKGLQKCLDGTFKVNDGCDEEVDYIRECMNNFMTEDCMNLDLPQAENLMQIILFNQMIYG